jgi:hypothetical protein
VFWNTGRPPKRNATPNTAPGGESPKPNKGPGQ